MLIHFYIFITALFASLIAVPGLRKWAFDTGTLDLSDERKVHKGMMPRLGGVAIFLAFFFSLLVFVDPSPMIRGILAGALVLFVTGLIDDLSGLTPKRKFLGEILGTAVTMYVSGLHISHLGNLFGTGDIVLPLWLALPFTVFAVVGVINAINLIDGLDGLSGGVSIIALGGFVLLGILYGNTEVTLLCAALIGAIFGFLKYNSYPARIFMGDVGSLVVGFLLAFMAIHLTQGPGAKVPAVVPLLLLGLPIIDTVWVMASRILRGISPFAADKTHVHHKFLDIGFKHKTSVVIIYSISMFWAVVGILLRDQPAWLLLLLFFVLSTVGYQAMRFVAYRPEEFSFLAFDTPRSILSTKLYRWMTGLGKYMVWALGFLLLAVLVMAIAAGCCVDEVAVKVILFTLAVGGGLLYVIRDVKDHFFQIYLFLVGLLLAFEIDQASSNLLFAGYTLGEATNLLFMIMAPLVTFKVLFRTRREILLSTPLDLLVLAMCVSLAIVSPQFEFTFNLPELTSKAIIIFLTIKILTNRSLSLSRPVCGTVMTSLVLLVVRSL